MIIFWMKSTGYITTTIFCLSKRCDVITLPHDFFLLNISTFVYYQIDEQEFNTLQWGLYELLKLTFFNSYMSGHIYILAI